jgi:hypothetical protein
MELKKANEIIKLQPYNNSAVDIEIDNIKDQIANSSFLEDQLITTGIHLLRLQRKMERWMRRREI